jgi:hypothetical protein
MQAANRICGDLSQDKIDKLNLIGFDWKYYENELFKNIKNYLKSNTPGNIAKDMLKDLKGKE